MIGKVIGKYRIDERLGKGGMGIVYKAWDMDVGDSGDTAYEIGEYILKIQPAGQEGMIDSGKYVVVWKRQADGTWKLHADIWNSSMPTPGQ